MKSNSRTLNGAASNAAPSSEALHPASDRLHALSSDEVLAMFEAEDKALLSALARARPDIARLGAGMHDAIARGGRIIYLGAGTSGRIGVLDAAEWGPTFGVAAGRVTAVLAGGDLALRQAAEGAEDRADEAVAALKSMKLAVPDLLVGLSASGHTPFVVAGLAHARAVDTPRALVTAETRELPRELGEDSGLIRISLAVGPEVLAGSTRLKAGAATHMVLQRASNLCAVASGWIFAGRMVEMLPTNRKLRARASRIVSEIAKVDEEHARRWLEKAGWDIKLALVCARSGVSLVEARARLNQVHRKLHLLEGFLC